MPAAVAIEDAVAERLPIIPDPPKRGAINNLKRALAARVKPDSGELGLTEDAAEAVARAVPEPDDTRKVGLKRVSYLTTRAGTFTVLRDVVNVLSIITYPLNPRVLETERYPAAVDAEASKGRLYWAQRDLTEDGASCELTLVGGSRARVKQTLQTHGKSVRQQNPLESIRDFGVMRPILLFPLRVATDDGPDRVVLSSAEGSSRTAYAQWLQGIDPGDPLYGPVANIDVAHAITRSLAEVRGAAASEVTDDDVVKARTLLVPAEIVIGFQPAADAERPTLRDGVDGLLAQTHIDHPRAWTQVAQDQAIADKILETLYERGHIESDAELRYLAGLMPRSEATAADFDAWPARRAAQIVRLLSRDANGAVGRAIGEGARRASFQRRAGRQLKAAVAAALALRALPEATVDDHKALRSALSRAFEAQMFWVDRRKAGSGDWRATTRDPDELRRLALGELEEEGTPGPATRELAALGAWVLTRRGILGRGRKRGTTEDSDPRDPQYVIAEMVTTRAGLETLYRAVEDDRADRHPRELDLATYKPMRAQSGGHVVMTERWVRKTVAPEPLSDQQSQEKSEPVGTPEDRFDNALKAIVNTVVAVPGDLLALDRILDDAKRPMLSNEGIDDAYTAQLNKALIDTLGIVRQHNEIHQKRYGISVSEADSEPEEDPGEEER